MRRFRRKVLSRDVAEDEDLMVPGGFRVHRQELREAGKEKKGMHGSVIILIDLIMLLEAVAIATEKCKIKKSKQTIANILTKHMHP